MRIHELTNVVRFKHALYYSVDGNFTQNMKDKGTDVDDLPLTRGAAYFADELDAKTYFAAQVKHNNQEVRVLIFYDKATGNN